jgi:hypothetical protein
VRCGGSRRRQRVPGAERDAPRPMNRDVPPCIRALRASLQPLIGGAIECVRRAVALVRKRSVYIRRRGTRSMGRSYTPRVCSFVDVHPQQHQALSHCAQPPTADVTCALVSHHLHSSARPDSRQTPTPDQPSSCSRRVIPAPAHRVRALGAAPDPALRSNGPWPHVTSGLLAPPGYIAILIFRPVSDPLCVGYRLRAIASWVPGVPGAHREADWGSSLGHIDSIRARKGTTTPNLPAREHLCSAKRCAARA